METIILTSQFSQQDFYPRFAIGLYVNTAGISPSLRWQKLRQKDYVASQVAGGGWKTFQFYQLYNFQCSTSYGKWDLCIQKKKIDQNPVPLFVVVIHGFYFLAIEP